MTNLSPGQSRRASLCEAISNVSFGFGIFVGVLIYYCFFEEEPTRRSSHSPKRDRDSH